MLDQTKFKQWLEGKDELDVVGESCNMFACPIAVYLEQQTGVFQVCVGDNHKIEIRTEAVSRWEHIDTPVWLRPFVLLVDQGGTRRPVIVAEAKLYFEQMNDESLIARLELAQLEAFNHKDLGNETQKNRV
jgi:hypothetical protein